MENFFPDLVHYTLRITKDLTMKQFNDTLQSIADKPVKKVNYKLLWCLGYEIGDETGKRHIHAYIVTNFPEKTLRARIRTEFSLSSNKGEYSLKLVEKKENALAYAIKEGEFMACPEFQPYISICPAWVSSEERVESFSKDLNDLTNKYLDESMSDVRFVLKLLELYSKHKKHLYIAHIRALWLGVANQRNLPFNQSGYMSGNSRPIRYAMLDEILRGFINYNP